MSDTFKWVMCGYDHWWFIVYNYPESFVGWYDGMGKLEFYATKEFYVLYPKAKHYFGTRHTKLSYNGHVEKKQWKGFISKQKREYKRQMIMDIF